jgi:hypothetical protein
LKGFATMDNNDIELGWNQMNEEGLKEAVGELVVLLNAAESADSIDTESLNARMITVMQWRVIYGTLYGVLNVTPEMTSEDAMLIIDDVADQFLSLDLENRFPDFYVAAARDEELFTIFLGVCYASFIVEYFPDEFKLDSQKFLEEIVRKYNNRKSRD